MYDKKLKKWIASEPAARSVRSGDEVSTGDALYNEYTIADANLMNVTVGTKNAEAVYRMEQIAKQGYAPACLAMAQMFEFGWAVAKSSKLTLKWYKKAAAAGSAEAILYIKKKKIAKRNKIISCCVITVSILTLAVLFITDVLQIPFSVDNSIVLPEDVEMECPQNIEQYAEIIRNMQNDYDNDDMRQGNAETNRILLLYRGSKLDLSDFSIAAASTDGDMLTLQFHDREEMLRCYEYLKALDGTEYISIDKYIAADLVSTADTATASMQNASIQMYHSNVSGFDYYSWGAIAMELDQYAAYLGTILPNKHLTVAVIDTGIEPNSETESRIVDGINIVYGGNGKMDVDIHGTHVSGTILDCTQGLNIDVMPIGVFPKDGGASDSAICLGLKYAIEADVQVINMSLGGYCSGNCIEEYFTEKAIDQGITVVVAAGNEHDDTAGVCPARITKCITVGAVDEYGNIASFSNYGSEVDVCAPGVSVLSYVPAPDYLAYLDGTSMASPHVAALAAMICLEYDARPANIEYYIRVYSDGRGNNKLFYGDGMPLAGNFVENVS